MTPTMLVSRLIPHKTPLLKRIFHTMPKQFRAVSTVRQVEPHPNNRESIRPSHITTKGTLPKQSGSFSRPLGALEKMTESISEVRGSTNREHTAFFTIVQVRFPPTLTNMEEYIASAWEEVGRQFPVLRAEASPPNKSDSHKQPMITLKSWNESNFRTSFSAHPDCPNVDVLFSAPSPRRSTATCHWLPDPGQIVIRTSHWRTDGFGLVLLAEAFLSTLANKLQTGLDVHLDNDLTEPPLTVPSTLEDLVQMYVRGPQGEASDADELAKIFVDGGRSIGFPTRPGADTAAPSVCGRAALRIDAENTANLVNACRAQGVSVTSALNAAVIRTTARFPQDPGADSYVFFAPVDLRGALIAAGAQGCSQPAGNYVSGMPLRIDGVAKQLENGDSMPSKSFGELAHELRAIYSQDITRYKRPGEAGAKTLSLLQLTEPYIEKMTELFSMFPSPGCPFPRTPVISSFGKMDALIKKEYCGSSDGATDAPKLYVTDFWVSCDCATPMIIFNPYSWCGEFTLLAAWDDSYYSREFVIDILKKTIAELSEGLEMGQLPYRITTG
ncbi:uncharacterized protein GGS22DRAFT_152891 [Annulohypoxylon maeteangense]|uniref:uncharacterized protein n=1 Tax=Annulohypoxylon maeteangense TaxID=1927788 RepID=UPI002007CD27|nr:uncharacterized protein GGS22DRAFT_152891 [Annulohypoxylon maeteangense]KAI0889002.1 hypothetical protein GGS22DRAFT_152891 [Annulohypoxylon maeteangense]